MDLKKVIYLSREDYLTLISAGTVTINGNTLTYDAGNLYIVPDEEYSFTGGTNEFTVTFPDGSTQTVTVGSTIERNVTKANAAVTSGRLVAWNADAAAGDDGVIKDAGASITTTAPSASNNVDTTVPTSKAVWSAITGASGYGKTGTVTSVRVQATSPVQSSTSTASSTTLDTTISLADNYGDTKNPYAAKTKNYILAGPNGTTGHTADAVPTFRALVSEDLPTYSSNIGSTVAVGGIPKNSTFTNKPIIDLIDEMLHPYVAFTFSSIATTVAAGTFEYGTEKSITKVKPTFTLGSKNINSVKIGTTSGGTDLYTGSTATNNTDIALTNAYSWDGLSNKTIYCTLSDGTTTTTKSVTFTQATYIYYKVTNSTSAPTSGCTKTNILCSTADAGQTSITTTDNTYIWFLSSSAKTKIQQYVTGQWNDMTTVSSGQVTLTLSNGKTYTYYAYRTEKMIAATGNYRLK